MTALSLVSSGLANIALSMGFGHIFVSASEAEGLQETSCWFQLKPVLVTVFLPIYLFFSGSDWIWYGDLVWRADKPCGMYLILCLLREVLSLCHCLLLHSLPASVFSGERSVAH